MSGPKVSDMIRQTFGISAAEWIVNGVTKSVGKWDSDPQYNVPPSQWADWPSHTAADMGPSRRVNPVAFALPAAKRVRA